MTDQSEPAVRIAELRRALYSEFSSAADIKLAMDTLRDVAKNAKRDSARVAAAKELLERLLGKAEGSDLVIENDHLLSELREMRALIDEIRASDREPEDGEE